MSEFLNDAKTFTDKLVGKNVTEITGIELLDETPSVVKEAFSNCKVDGDAKLYNFHVNKEDKEFVNNLLNKYSLNYVEKEGRIDTLAEMNVFVEGDAFGKGPDFMQAVKSYGQIEQAMNILKDVEKRNEKSPQALLNRIGEMRNKTQG